MDQYGTLPAIIRRFCSTPFYTSPALWDPVSLRMVEIGRPDLTVFRFLLRSEWRELFTVEQRKLARLMLERQKAPSEGALEWLDMQRENVEADCSDEVEQEWVRKVQEEAVQLADSLLEARLKLQPQSGHDEQDAWLMERVLNEHITRRFLGRIPKFVNRALRLDPLICTEAVPEDVQEYMEESTRCYVFGHWRASVSLARSALERGLKDRIGRADQLNVLIDEGYSCGVLDKDHQDFAHAVREKGNLVLHENPAKNEAPALTVEVLDLTRKVLQFLYTDKGI